MASRNIPRTCEICSIPFLGWSNGVGRFCSIPCRTEGKKQDLATRFWENVDKSGCGPKGECWVWTAALYPDGYGVMRVKSRNERAHRVSYMLTHAAELKPSQFVLRECDNPPCVRPDHLFLGNPKANAQDCKSKQRNVRGEKGYHKLTTAQVLAIRADARLHRIIAQDYGVCRPTIDRIKFGRAWKHLLTG